MADKSLRNDKRVCNRLAGEIVTFLNVEINEEPNKRGEGEREEGQKRKEAIDKRAKLGEGK